MVSDDLATSGNVALAEGRWEDAARAFEQLLAAEERADLRMGLAQALWWMGATHESVECCERAYTEFHRLGDQLGAGTAAMWLSITYRSNYGNAAAASGWLARTERSFDSIREHGMEGWLELTRGYVADDVDVMLAVSRRALEHARATGDDDLELCALSQLGRALVVGGDVDEGLALIDDAMAGTLARTYAKLDTVVYTTCDMLNACEVAADLERAAQWCRVADTFMDRYGCPFLYAECRTVYGAILLARGRWDEADAALVAVVEMTGDAAPAMRAAAMAHLADLRLYQGRREEAAALVASIDDEFVAARPAAQLRLLAAEPAAAVRVVERALHTEYVRGAHKVALLELLAAAHVAGGDVEAASLAVKALHLMARERASDEIAARADAAAGRVAAATGDDDVAIEHFEHAHERFARLDLPFEVARTRLALAKVLASRQPDAAIAEGRAALDSCLRLGATAAADDTAALLRSLGINGRTGTKHAGALTDREREVLDLLACGLSNPEIAQRLYISRKTASHHVSNVLTKLGVRNRTEAAAFAARGDRTR